MAFDYVIYFTDRKKNRVVRWDPNSNDTRIVAEGGHSTDESQRLSDPYGLAFSGDSLLVADKFHHRICRIKRGRVETLPLHTTDGHRARRSDSPAFFNPDELPCPTSLFGEPSGAVLCTFFEDHTIYRIHADGRLEHLLGVVRNVPHLKDAPSEYVSLQDVRKTPLWGPTGIVERPDGTLFFVERDAQLVREYHPSRGLRSVFGVNDRTRWLEVAEAPASGNTGEYHPVSPCSLALDNQGRLHVCDPIHASVLRIEPDERFTRVVLSTRKPEVYVDRGPLAVAFGSDGTAWLADSAAESIQGYQIDNTGHWTPLEARLTSVLGEPLDLAPGGMGLVLGS